MVRGKERRGKERRGRGRGRGRGDPFEGGQDQDAGFMKRKIESNRGRYKDPDEESEVECHSEETDFSFIKTNAGLGEAAHFRFKEEHEWDDVNEEKNNILELNLDVLAAELSNIPIYEKLALHDVDEELRQYVDVLKVDTNVEEDIDFHEETTAVGYAMWDRTGMEKFDKMIDALNRSVEYRMSDNIDEDCKKFSGNLSVNETTEFPIVPPKTAERTNLPVSSQPVGEEPCNELDLDSLLDCASGGDVSQKETKSEDEWLDILLS